MSDGSRETGPSEDDRNDDGERRRQRKGRRREPRYDPHTGEPVPDRRRENRDDD